MTRLSRHQRWLIKRRDRELRPRGCPQPIFRLPPENPAPRPAWWGIDEIVFRPTVEFELNTRGSFDGPSLITPKMPFNEK